MGQADYLELGDWNAVCEMCGRKRKASTMVKNWQGGWRCPEHNEPRQPQDFVRATADVQRPPWTQPRPQHLYAARCTPNGITAYPGYAVPGCVIPNYVHPMFDADVVDIDDMSAAEISAGSFVTGTVYQITVLGNTNWNAIGYSGIPVYGGIFTATGAGTASTFGGKAIVF